MATHLPFGIDEAGHPRGPTEVPNGKACRCICDECGRALIAYQNFTKDTRPHFRHTAWDRAGDPPACSGGLESTLHKMAKRIIMERGYLQLPAFERAPIMKDASGAVHTGRVIKGPGGRVRFDRIIDEVGIGIFRADLLAEKGSSKLAIEIVVTNDVKAAKQQGIQGLHTSALRVQLTHLKADKFLQAADVERAIYDEPKNLSWIHYEPAVGAWESAVAELTKHVQAVNESLDRSAVLASLKARVRTARQGRLKRVADAIYRRAEWSRVWPGNSPFNGDVPPKAPYPEELAPFLYCQRMELDDVVESGAEWAWRQVILSALFESNRPLPLAELWGRLVSHLPSGHELLQYQSVRTEIYADADALGMGAELERSEPLPDASVLLMQYIEALLGQALLATSSEGYRVVASLEALAGRSKAKQDEADRVRALERDHEAALREHHAKKLRLADDWAMALAMAPTVEARIAVVQLLSTNPNLDVKIAVHALFSITRQWYYRLARPEEGNWSLYWDLACRKAATVEQLDWPDDESRVWRDMLAVIRAQPHLLKQK